MLKCAILVSMKVIELDRRTGKGRLDYQQLIFGDFVCGISDEHGITTCEVKERPEVTARVKELAAQEPAKCVGVDYSDRADQARRKRESNWTPAWTKGHYPKSVRDAQAALRKEVRERKDYFERLEARNVPMQVPPRDLDPKTQLAVTRWATGVG